MNWILLIIIIYFVLLVVVCTHIISITKHTNKAIAYLLFAVFIPVIGMGFYFLFGINYWTKRRYNKKTIANEKILQQLKKDIVHYDEASISYQDESVQQHAELAAMLVGDLGSPLTKNNSIKLLQNGEEKFPELLRPSAMQNTIYTLSIISMSMMTLVQQ